MQVIVLDASVAVKWYCEETDTNVALEIQEQYLSGELRICFPDLVFLELANAIRYKENSRLKDVKNVLENFVKLRFNIITPTVKLIEEAARISFDFDVTVYDGIYIALARELRTQFVTADEKLYRRIEQLPFVKLLKEVKLKKM